MDANNMDMVTGISAKQQTRKRGIGNRIREEQGLGNRIGNNRE